MTEAGATPTSAATPRRWPAHLAAVGHTVGAALTYIIAKDTTAERFADPLVVGWFRIQVAVLLIVAVRLLAGRPSGKPGVTWGQAPQLILLGTLGVTVNQVVFLFGIKHTTPTHAALIMAFIPVAVMAGSVTFLRERLTAKKVFGLLLALGGVALVLGEHGLDLAAGGTQGNLILLVPMLAFSTYTLVGKPLLATYDPLDVTMWVFVVGAVTLWGAAPWLLPGLDLAAPGWQGWGGVLWLAGVTSVTMFSLWYFALSRLQAGELAVYTNLQPPAAALFAWILLGTTPTLLLVLGGGLVIAGVTAVQRSRR